MDYTDEELADLAEMRELRLRLRACARAKVAECEALPAAKTTLEMNRQIRAIDGADRLVVTLYTPRRSSGRKSAPKPAPKSSPYDDICHITNAMIPVIQAAKRVPHLRSTKPSPPLPPSFIIETEAGPQFNVDAAMAELLDIMKGLLRDGGTHPAAGKPSPDDRSLSAKYGSGADAPDAGEQPGIPWWAAHKKPPPI